MGTLLEFKELIRNFYGKYDSYLVSIGKFIIALCAFIMINIKLGQMHLLNNPVIVVILALVCSFLPLNAIVLFGAALIIGHLYALSLEAFLVGTGILVVILLLYFGIAPKESLAIILTPIACGLNIPCAVPLMLGLVRTPFAGIGIAFGTIGYYTVAVLDDKAKGITATAKDATEAMVQKLTGLLDSILKNPEMIISVITMLAVIIMVYVIRRMAIKYSWSIAILVGAFIFLISTLMGTIAMGTGKNFLAVILGTAISAAIAFLVKLFLFEVDYKRTQKVQFEDDDYYYFVKAVPKTVVKQRKKEIRQEEPVRNSRNEGRSAAERPKRVRRGEPGRSDLDIKDY